MKRVSFAALLLAVVCAAAAEQGVISGRVVGPEGEAVEGACVATLATDGKGGFIWVEDFTDEGGRLQLSGSLVGERGKYYVVCVAEGYAVGGNWFAVGDDIELRLTHEALQVSGTVTGPGGGPIPGAEVRLIRIELAGPPSDDDDLTQDERAARRVANTIILERWDGAPQARTGRDGRFSLKGVPAGASAWIQATAEGHVLGGTVWSPAAREVQIALVRAGSIAGRVTLRGEPVGGATVRVGPHRRVLAYSRHTAVTDGDGRYELSGLPEGTHVVAVAPSAEYAMAFREGVHVRAGQRTDGIDLELIEGILVEGTVTWADSGRPIAGAFVWGRTEDDHAVMGRAETDEAGDYALRLPPGSYSIDAGGVDSWAMERDRPRLELHAGDGARTVELSLLRQPVVWLNITNPDGSPAAGAQVVWAEGAGLTGWMERPERGTADENGRMSIRPRARHRGGDEDVWHPRVSVLVQDVQRCLAAFRLIEAGGSYDVQLSEGGWIAITVKDGDRRGYSGVQFAVHLPEQERLLPLQPSTGDDGRVRIGPLPAGLAIELRVEPEVQRMATEPSWSQKEPIEVVGGETLELQPLIVIPEGLSIRGRIVDTHGNPVEGALVLCDASVSRDPARATTNAEGRFELRGLRASEDVVVVVATDTKGTRAYAQLCDPHVAHEPVFELAQPGTLSGMLVTEDGQPVAGKRLHVSVFGAHLDLPGDLTTSAFVHSDGEGRWRVEGIVPGVEYRISVEGTSEGAFYGIERVLVYGDEGPLRLTVPARHIR